MRARRIADLGLAAVVLAAMITLHRTTPGPNEFEQPVEVNGSLGRTVRTPLFDLTVDKVRAGKELDVPKYKDDLTTATDFVVVDAIVTATRKPILLGTVRVRTEDGDMYLASERKGFDRGDLGSSELAPGITERGSFVIEMPADKLKGSRLEVIESSADRFEPQATVPLDGTTVEDRVAVENATAS